ncbi:MAG: response regulator [Candidatus Krumholzibacteriota bacterium]|nr:response regulator [Candidatus Krumholzibacteriota bacterium]
MARILVVDDDPDVVEATKMYLEKEGHDVATAFSRDEGMKHIAAEHPDLLVLDVMMDEPDDGIFMAQELRKSGFERPILMMSSIDKVTGMHYDKDDEVTPVDDFIEKPVAPATLVEKVKALLNR